MAKAFSFRAADSLFFRDGRPFNAGESLWADSMFPPTPFTMLGAVRAALLAANGADLRDSARFFRDGPKSPRFARLLSVVGGPDHVGTLRVAGPFFSDVRAGSELLFPAPRDLVATAADQYDLLRPGNSPTRSDLGSVRLPGRQGMGSRFQEGMWITTSGMTKVLSGDTSLSAGELRPLFAGAEDAHALADAERRIGLKRDAGRRTAEDGMLYAVSHVRPRDGWAGAPQVRLMAVVDGVPDDLLPSGMAVRIGGEARIAELTVVDAPRLPPAPHLEPIRGKVRFRLILTTPGLMSGGWLPAGFVQEDPDDADAATRWRGAVQGVPLTVVSGCVGNAQRIGGWDLARNRPRDARPHIPAGSVLFCETDAAHAEAVRQLHGSHIGENTDWGFGHVLLGAW